MFKVTILDGYVDEPTCLGVPPYISPYPRYIAGAIWSYDKSVNINYLTIDQIRQDERFRKNLSESDLIVAIAGMEVPGRYLSGFPVSPRELVTFLGGLNNPLKVLTGPAAKYGFGVSGGKKTRDTKTVGDVFDLIISGDGEIVISELLKNKLNLDKVDPSLCRESAQSIGSFATFGSKVVGQHPFFPNYLITEIETYRGCSRTIVGGCSFCIEPSKGLPDFRSIDDVIDEIRALYDVGVRHFRLGNQPCIFSYMARDAGKTEFPRPNPEALENLFKGIRSVAPDLRTLHIDNANPGVIARFPKECKSIAKTIVRYHTSGDVAALGVESVDPVVIKKNNLKASETEVLSAIRLLNDVGAARGGNGMSEFLPGLNFVFGLDGETKNTFELNYLFLKKIFDEGLLLRRINLRQVISIPGTRMEKTGSRFVLKNKHFFKRFKRRVRKEIERPMLERLLPIGSVMRDVYSEKHDGRLTFARQLGSYPLLVGIPGVLDLHSFYDVKIVDYGFRSITGVPFPMDVNLASREMLESIPGVGKKRAIRILANRPFNSEKELYAAMDDENVVKELLNYFPFSE